MEKEIKEIDFSEFTDKEKLEELKAELVAKGTKIQKFVGAKGKELPYAEARLFSELFNVYASGIDCITAILSIKKN